MPEPITTIAIFVGGFLLSYLSQKGKNLAYKEDMVKLTNDINRLNSSLRTNSQNSISLREERVEVLNSFFDSCNQFLFEILEVRTTEAPFKPTSFEDFLLSIHNEDFLLYMFQQQISNLSNCRLFLRSLVHEVASKHHKLLLYFYKKPLAHISEILTEKMFGLFNAYYKSTEIFVRNTINIEKIDNKILQEFQEKYKKEVLPNY